MEYTPLGRTGLRVSKLALGTAAFGLENYGIQEPGEPSRLSENDASALIRTALDQGINFFDTARGYGESEAILGKGLGNCKSCTVATKVGTAEAFLGSAALTRSVTASIHCSLKALRRDALDIVQVHNATEEILHRGDVLDILDRAREAGKLKVIGASVYGEPAAMAAIRSGRVEVLQIAVNLLDQRMLAVVLPEAKKNNVGVIVRSAFLKGALTERARLLPDALRRLAEASDITRQALGESWESLPGTALRFCLSVPGVHSVLVGLRNHAELTGALAAQEAGSLDDVAMRETESLKLNDEHLLDPSYWPLV